MKEFKKDKLTVKVMTTRTEMGQVAAQVSQVPDRTFDTRPPTIPRPLVHVPCRFGRVAKASPFIRGWPTGRKINEASHIRFIFIGTHAFVRQDSRTSVTLRTACPPTHITTFL